MSVLTPLPEYYDLLNQHDWVYEMTDDHKVWDKQNRMRQRLRFQAEQSAPHMRLYKAVQAYKRGYTNKMPERPEGP